MLELSLWGQGGTGYGRAPAGLRPGSRLFLGEEGGLEAQDTSSQWEAKREDLGQPVATVELFPELREQSGGILVLWMSRSVRHLHSLCLPGGEEGFQARDLWAIVGVG